MRFIQKSSPRAAFQQQESLRIQSAASLKDTFPELQSLTINLTYLDAEGFTLPGIIKYTVNLLNAKCLFFLSCPNTQCVGGHFDLSAQLASLVAAHCPAASGEAICQGWRNQASIEKVYCHHRLRYQLSIEYRALAGCGESDKLQFDPTLWHSLRLMTIDMTLTLAPHIPLQGGGDRLKSPAKAGPLLG